MSVRARLAAFWADLTGPSAVDESPYARCVIAVAHAVLGAALVWLASFAGVGPGAAAAAAMAARSALPLLYWLFKERRDLARGGDLIDSITDTAFIAAGALFLPATGGMAAILLAAFLAAILIGVKRA